MSDTNEIVTQIKNVLDHVPSTPPDRIVPRVPNHLRKVKNEAYEPDIISIGPYHRGKDHLTVMEEHKFRYLKLLLERRDESSLAKYVEALSELNKSARNSYEERFLDERQFLETMLVDACFIVELIRKGVAENGSTEDDDPIFRSEMTLYSLKYDLLLIENQLPFFILQKLFDMTLLPNEESNFVDMIFRFFKILPGAAHAQRIESYWPEFPVRHLLGLMHHNWIPSPETYLTDQGKQRTNDAKAHIRCATELHEAGIKFKRAEAERGSIFDIKFANGVLEIPKLTIENRTESLLRNLIAYEYFWKDDIYSATDEAMFIDYAMFMDCLVNSNKDVELLCRSGIIDNWLGDDEVVASMFNRLLDNVRPYRERSFYSEIYVNVNMYCGRDWNVWKAKLRHDYFNGPWALISFLAALFLLLLTVLQTVYSILSFHHS